MLDGEDPFSAPTLERDEDDYLAVPAELLQRAELGYEDVAGVDVNAAAVGGVVAKLAKNGPTAATGADRVFAELAHATFCTPRRIAVSGQLDQLRRAFDDTTLEISLSAAGKARAAAAFANKATTDKRAPTESAERRKQREQAAAVRKAAATAAAADKIKAKVTK
eukprot:jgi/Tetstr1/428182/TSEL_018233.t1